MKKHTHVAPKGKVRQLFCRHIWSEPQGGRKLFFGVDLAPYYQICLKCGREREIIMVEATKDPKDALVEEAERLLREAD